MSNQIILSAIIPMYNVETYIKRLFDTLKKQINEKIELVFVDDGSKDNTIEILEYASKGYPNVVISKQENKGVSAARNKGLLLSKGEYVTFIDSDDLVKDDYFDSMLKLIKLNPSSEMIITGVKVYDVDGNLYDTIANNNTVLSSNEAVVEHLLSDKMKTSYSMWSKIISKDFLNKKEILFDEDARCMSDGLFFSQCYYYAENVILSDYVGYFWMRRRDSITTTYYNNLPEIVNKFQNNNNRISRKSHDNILSTNWILKQKKFCFDYQIAKIRSSKLTGIRKLKAVKCAISNSLDLDVIKKYYYGFEFIIMILIYYTKSSVLFDIKYFVIKILFYLKKIGNRIKRGVICH